MLKWFKNHFIPYSGNRYHPDFFSSTNTLVIVTILVFIELVFFMGPRFIADYQPASVISGVLGDLTNLERKQNNLSSLKANPILSEAAQLKANDMVAKDYFAHTSPEGLTPWHWLDEVGYKYNYAGENLAVNFTDTEDVTNAWMKSPTHRANIVKNGYTEMGSAVATGTYKGRESVFAVQIYANPAASEVVAKITSTQAAPVAKVNVASAPIKEVGNVLGTTSEERLAVATEEVKNNHETSFWQRLFASPRQTTNTILVFLLIIVGIALLLNIFIKFSVQYRDVIINALIIIAVIIVMILLNMYYSNNVIIKSTIDYSNTTSA
jgi:ABC-type sugar transport system permease subunit